MYNPQIYSSALLVFAFYIKTLTGLPFEVQPAHVAPPQHDPAVPPSTSNIPAGSIDVRSLNVSESNPSLRTGDIQNASVEAVAPAVRSLPSNPANSPQVEDVAARNGFGLESQPITPAAAPARGSWDQHSPQQRFDLPPTNLNESQQGAPALRSGREDLTSNVTNVEARSLNVGSPSPAAPVSHLTNDTPIEARSLDLNAPPQTVNASGSSSFVPSFLKSFGLRQKRGEEDSSVAEAAEQASTGDNPPLIAVAERNSFDEASPVSNADGVPQVNLKGAPNDANVQSRLELVSLDPAASSSVNVPYINVYPVDNLEF